MAKKKEEQVVSCKQCFYATLMRNGNNPVIAECSSRGGERFVASTPMACSKFKPSAEEKKLAPFVRAK